MSGRSGAAMAGAAVGAAIAWVLVFSGGSTTPPALREADSGTSRLTPASSPAAARVGAREDCSTRSEANFPGAFTSPRNLVVGPLVLIGGAYTDARTVREFGGNKFPLLVKAGHTVTMRLARPEPMAAGLAYGPLPQGETKLRDTHQSVTLVACRAGASGSRADGVAVTFWSGFVLTRAPACIPLEIYLDDAPSPQRIGLPLGRRCDR